MTKVDQFESVFRSADKPVFQHEKIAVRKVLVVTDHDEAGAQALGDTLRGFLSILDSDQPEWRAVHGGEYDDIETLLKLVEREAPDLICAYRCLKTDGWKYPYTLGKFLDVLTQATPVPVLVIPHPDAGRASEHAMENTNHVMAITDHLAGDARLVNYAVRLAEPGGELWLTHVEDENTFERYMAVIAKLPAIDTETARIDIHEKLLKEPADFIASCRTVLAEAGVKTAVKDLVTVGHHLAEYRKLIEEQHVDLLVMNTKDADQMAMHGLAYPLAVELRQIPLLML